MKMGVIVLLVVLFPDRWIPLLEKDYRIRYNVYGYKKEEGII